MAKIEKTEYFFLWTGKTVKMEKKVLIEADNKVKNIISELNTQCHLHGENTPAPANLIAIECYIEGVIDGGNNAMDNLLKKLGLYDEYTIRQRKEAMEKLRKRYERLVRQIVNRNPRAGVLKKLDELSKKVLIPEDVVPEINTEKCDGCGEVYIKGELARDYVDSAMLVCDNCKSEGE